MKYHHVIPIDRSLAIATFRESDSNAICDALVSIAFHDPDWKWVQAQTLPFLKHSNENITGVALTCLGHIARIHGQIDLEVVLPEVQRLLSHKTLGGRAEDAMDDIRMFAMP